MGNLAAAADRGPKDFPELLLTPGVGARTVQALAMVAEVVHGAPYRFTDPARFSIANGGKDRHPFPVPIKVYDETIKVLKLAVQKAKLGLDEELGALRRLDEQARRLERHASGASVEKFIAEELRHSHSYGGRSVFGWESPRSDSVKDQPTLTPLSRRVPARASDIRFGLAAEIDRPVIGLVRHRLSEFWIAGEVEIAADHVHSVGCHS
jgi:hypothetical protein